MRKLILLFLLLPVTVIAQKNYPALFDEYMQAQVNVNDFTGTVLVAQKGKIIYEKAFGMADREFNVPNTIETKFEIGSITKQFNACCILQLADEGKLSLDDNLSKYFPDFPKGDSITIHMLLTHTSGIKNYTELQEFWKIASFPVEKDTMVALIKKQPFNFSPGTKWSYSNSGYFLLGYIIEKVSGKSYSNYVLKNVIEKASLKNTCVNRWDSIITNRARGYEKARGKEWKNTSYISMEGPYSAGAIISTVEDLYQWNTALFSNKIIPQTMLAKMITPHKQHYGYGIGIDTFNNHLLISHNGGINGFQSFLGYFPTDDVIVAGLSNNGYLGPQGVVTALAAMIFDIPVEAPYQHKEIKIDSALLNRYAGKYKQLNGNVDTFKIKTGKLYLHPQDNNEEYELKPESETKFFFAEDPGFVQFEFETDNKGKVVQASIIEGGIKSEMKKL